MAQDEAACRAAKAEDDGEVPTPWRDRMGDFRIIDDVLHEALVVTVLRASHRPETYDG